MGPEIIRRDLPTENLREPFASKEIALVQQGMFVNEMEKRSLATSQELQNDRKQVRRTINEHATVGINGGARGGKAKRGGESRGPEGTAGIVEPLF